MTEKPRSVLLVTPWDREGGLSTYSRYLENALTSRVDVSVFEWNYEHILKRGSGVKAFSSRFFDSVRTAEVVHVQYTFGRYLFSMFLIALICTFIGKPIVITQHERFDNLPFSGLIFYWHQILYFFVDEIIVHTEKRKSMIWGLHRAKVTVVPHGVKYHKVTAANSSEVNEIVIPGIVRQIKGHARLVESLRYLPDDITLRILGSASDEKYVQKVQTIIDEYDLGDRVNWKDEFIPEDRMFEEIDQADLIVLPYEDHTSMSGILAHCISWKTPTLVTDCPSFRCVIGSDAAFLNGRTPEAIAESIQRARDANVRREIREEFESLVDSYSWDVVAERTVETYREDLL